jgi:hypothetical protein
MTAANWSAGVAAVPAIGAGAVAESTCPCGLRGVEPRGARGGVELLRCRLSSRPMRLLGQDVGKVGLDGFVVDDPARVEIAGVVGKRRDGVGRVGELARGQNFDPGSYGCTAPLLGLGLPARGLFGQALGLGLLRRLEAIELGQLRLGFFELRVVVLGSLHPLAGFGFPVRDLLGLGLGRLASRVGRLRVGHGTPLC